MKHILAALLAIACILTLCACGASETQSTNSKNSVRTDESKTSFSEGVGSNSLPVQKTQAKDLRVCFDLAEIACGDHRSRAFRNDKAH